MKLLLIFSLLLAQIYAAPAFNKLREFKQADGSTFEARAYGNQHLHWIQTPQGEILLYNAKSKNFEYATIQNNTLKPSGTKYDQKNSIRARSQARVNKVDKEELYKLWSLKQKEFYEKRGLLKHQH